MRLRAGAATLRIRRMLNPTSRRDDTDGFLRPEDLPAPSLAAAIAATPDDACIKGTFIQGLIDCLPAEERPAAFVGAERLLARRVPFKDYPVRDFIEVAVRVAQAGHPGLPLAAALRAVGRVNYRTFLNTLTGRVVFGVLGGDIRKLIGATGKAYSVTQTHGRAEVIESADAHCVLRYSGIYQFLGSMEVGVVEEAVTSCGFEPDVRVRLSSPHDGLMRVRFNAR